MAASIDDKYSLLYKRRETVHVPLPPSYIGSRGRGVRQFLDTWKGQYVQRLHGVLLRYENLKLQQPSNAIIDDQPYVHYDVQADFYIFSPQVGSIVRGRINRMTKSHVGCLIHDTINASVLVPEEPSADLASYLRLGQEILFRIHSVAMQRNHSLKLHAAITKRCIKSMLKHIPCVEDPPPLEEGTLSEDTQQDIPEEHYETQNGNGLEDSTFDSDATVALEPLEAAWSPQEHRKKKKKKKQEEKFSEEKMKKEEFSEENERNQEEEACLKKKKRKKEESPPVKKKKMKKDGSPEKKMKKEASPEKKMKKHGSPEKKKKLKKEGSPEKKMKKDGSSEKKKKLKKEGSPEKKKKKKKSFQGE